MINVAIDGPAGAGKSTIAKAAAKQLNYIYVDTGALYRTIALYFKRNNINIENADISSVLSGIDIKLSFDDNGEQRIILNNEDVSNLIRTPEISMLSSQVSQIPLVRNFLLETQRNIARSNNVIMDGRDIATVVLPNANVKIYLFASAEIRAHRRYLELLEKGENVDYNDVLSDLNRRDKEDKTRKIAPLKPADDAIMVDTTEYTLEESIEIIV